MQHVIIYCHGFLSSPQSVKAQQTLQYIQAHYPKLTVEIPELPHYPADAAKMLESLVEKHQGKHLRFIGSSMGGYLSTYLVEKYTGKAVLINPAVKPFELLRNYLGEHQNPYTDKNFTLTEEHIDQLLALNTASLLAPENYWVLLQTGDETLDYRQAEQKYQRSKLTIEEGGDHSFVDYQQHLASILAFLLRD